ncbi:GNAT family N-acetyltransferase [Rudanella lutea]|uniref:GNAT family N-acetyltransferase n=1 Tax=Rudanella lutea TaxID=451374 RepID=UPI00035EF5E6|nr:GNAT family N-acetyltransferase [Rudanella lutea]
MNRLVFETERLRLESLTLADSPFIVELLNTPGWLQYIGDRNVRTEQQAEEYLRQGPLKNYERFGFGLGRVTLKETGEPIGLCGFLQRDYLEHPDIGYALLPAFVGQGYAYEVARQALVVGFGELGLPKLQAITLPTNVPSVGLLKRLGFTLESELTREGDDTLLLFGLSATR